MTLPAFTLCFFSLNSKPNNATLNESLYNCSISGTECDSKDFYTFESRASYNNANMSCYVLNGGKNSTGHPSEIKSTITFFLPKDHSICYYINDAYVKPTSSEIIKILAPGTSNVIKLEKTVETKFEYPFNNCWILSNLPDTSLVRQLSAENITYRQVNCFELCLQNYVQKYALENEIGEDKAILKEEVKKYDKIKNCSHLCPLECESTQYKMSESMFTLGDFSTIEEYSLQNIPFIQNKLNITVNSTEEFNKKNLLLQLNFDSLK